MAKSELTKLQTKLDRVFSIYIRTRDADNCGIVSCCTCGKLTSWKQTDAGHFMSRRYQATRYDEKNVAVQCVACNRFNQGRQFEFAQYIDKKYGPGTAADLEQKSKMFAKRNRYDYQVLIEHYKKLTKSLEK